MSKPIFPPPLRVICADHSKFYPIHTLNDVMVVSRLLKWQINHGLLYNINREEMIKTKYSIFHFIPPNIFCLVRYIILIHIYEMPVLKIIKLFMVSWMKNEPIVRTIQKYIPYKLKPLSFWECVSVDQKKKRKMEEFFHKPLSAYTKFGYYDSCYIWLNYFACKKFCSILFWMDGWNIAFVPICPL